MTTFPGDKVLTGHGVLIVQDSRTPDLQKNKICGCEQNKIEVDVMDNQPWNCWSRVVSDEELSLFTFGSVIVHTAGCTLTVHYTWPLISAKTWCPCSPNALVHMFFFSADTRLEFGWEITAGLSAASQKQWDTRLYYNRSKVSREVGTISLLGF